VLKLIFISDASGKVLPIDWSKMAAEVVVRLVELINEARAQRTKSQL